MGKGFLGVGEGVNEVPRGYRDCFNSGPLGLGDPDDKRINMFERTRIVPQWQRDIIKETHCGSETKEFINCAEKQGRLSLLRCWDVKKALNNCVEPYMSDTSIRERAQAEFLEERKLFRITGKLKPERESPEPKVEIDKINYFKNLFT